jgi:hypothetical protein
MERSHPGGTVFRCTDRVVVGRNVTLTLRLIGRNVTLTLSRMIYREWRHRERSRMESTELLVGELRYSVVIIG